MIRSMTAFAGSEADAEDFRLVWELRSVNHRYLDISLRLAEPFRFLEQDIRTLLSARLKRGKIDCTLTLKKTEKAASELRFDRQAARALLKAAQEVESMMVNPASFGALDVLNWPGVQKEPEADLEGLKRSALAALQEAVQTLIENREREGARLAQLIEERCSAVSALVVAARSRMPEVLDNLRTKLRDRIADLVESPDTERLEQELVFLAQKLDVDEELDRLDAHVEEIARVLAQAEPVGRRLDFLMQEMNREANTLGSKSTDTEMTRISVDLKVLIEQMREQIQNIE